MDHLATGVEAGSGISEKISFDISKWSRVKKPLGPTVGPGGLKVVDQVAREESFLGKVSRLANTSKRVAGADGG